MESGEVTTVQKRNISISLIRLLATLSIVSCHMMQWANCELAWWFNVGVQIFLCMSGYLYGMRTVDDDLAFYRKNFTKILLDYWIVILIAAAPLYIWHRDDITVLMVVKALLTADVLPGGEHLWFIPYILLCYFLTPFFSRMFEKTLSRKRGSVCSVVVLIFVVLAVWIVLTEFMKGRFESAWVNCYFIGLYLGKLRSLSYRKEYTLLKTLIVIAAVGFNTVQIVTDYTPVPLYTILLRGNFVYYYKLFCNYAHMFLGIALFLILLDGFDIIFSEKSFSESLEKQENKRLPVQSGEGTAKTILAKICAVSDRYSYDIYLVHQWFILGPFSLMGLSNYRGADICLILLLVCVATVIVRVASNCLFNRI